MELTPGRNGRRTWCESLALALRAKRFNWANSPMCFRLSATSRVAILTSVDHFQDVIGLVICCFLMATRFIFFGAMPPTTSLAGIPCVAVVFARLLVNGESQGVEPFIVPINDSTRVRLGIASRALPVRPGTNLLDHSITTFNNVELLPKRYVARPLKPKTTGQSFWTRSSAFPWGPCHCPLWACRP